MPAHAPRPAAPFALSLGLALALAGCGGGGPVNNNPSDTGDPFAGVPNLVLSTTRIDFGVLAIGQSASETLTFQNNGQAALTISGVSVPAPFTTSFINPLTLSAGSSTTIIVTFTPTGYDEVEELLTVSSDDPDQPSLTAKLLGDVVTDNDGDGYDAIEVGGDDCDDDDDDVHPDADDAWYDGVDSDCAGNDDYDADGDGWQVSNHNSDPGSGGGDCNDTNASVFPGAADAWYDGVDTDCDGSDDWDQDGDGERTTYNNRGDDCDDTNPAVHPDAQERFDGADNDCDGSTDLEMDGTVADVTLTGVSTNNYAGWALTMGDLDGDGTDDLMVGSYGHTSNRGAVSVWYGGGLPTDGATIEEADDWFQGANYSSTGSDLAWIDGWSGSGAFLAVGAPGSSSNAGTVYLISGADVAAGGDTGDAALTLTGSSGYYVGRGMAEDLDLDGDGRDELFGYYASSTSGTAYGYLYLLYAGTTGSLSLTAVDARFSTTARNTTLTRSFPHGGDLDGDGYDDAIYCDSTASVSGSNTGTVWAIWGKGSEYTNSAVTSITEVGSVVLAGSTNNDKVGYTCGIGPDLDGDGDGELWTYNAGQTSVTMVKGGTDLRTGSHDPATKAAVTYTTSSSAPELEVFGLIGDWSGDGISEVAFGAEASSSVTKGGLFVYDSELTSGGGSYDDDALASFVGDSASGSVYYGDSLSGRPGDLDGDGKPELVIGDPGWADPAGTKTVVGATTIHRHP
jgi:hypothetical protein